MTSDYLIEMGVRVPDLIAGLAGGVVNAFVFKRVTPIAIIGSVIVGALTANYIGEAAAHLMGVNTQTASFLVGVGGMALVQAMLDMAVKKLRIGTTLGPGNPGGTNAE